MQFRHILSIATLMASCSVQSLHAAEIADPLEPMNRGVFTFNEYADMLVMKPVTQAYDYVVPDEGKQGVSNVIRNLQMPVYFANSVLQGDAENAFASVWSFMLNSTFGVAGFFDFAGATGLHVRNEDFGQTLGVWGVGRGPYIVLPFFGPSSLRDSTGITGDFFFDPYNMIKSNEFIVARIGLIGLDTRYRNATIIDDIMEQSFDPYATFRSAYDQQRQAAIVNTTSNDFIGEE
ncbi:MAG: VacJ family lipoprotein [Alphaproteobacteria bacterium]|nr:MAG: VacJ family lipoprotein [Alphaproteobacteria bacterium]TAF14881.1 MAG: VacJ family lipoprotein [Alphaproteobacteria bacterium]TAF41434.1 MAG: VacJ family lipoprotein [Alphaproteobacteria bacterium]TAF75397.1 MAG: VacJ family lipoprotein [Alphaproteobacteria bacterium]